MEGHNNRILIAQNHLPESQVNRLGMSNGDITEVVIETDFFLD